jgi:hypothetical protein
MGTWGVGVFDDDIASDVRAEWREAILEGANPEDAAATLTSSYADGSRAAGRDRDLSASAFHAPAAESTAPDGP